MLHDVFIELTMYPDKTGHGGYGSLQQAQHCNCMHLVTTLKRITVMSCQFRPQCHRDDFFCTSAVAAVSGSWPDCTWICANIKSTGDAKSSQQSVVSKLLPCSRRWSRVCSKARCLIDVASIVDLDTPHRCKIIPGLQHSQVSSLCCCTIGVLVKPWHSLYRIAQSVATCCHHCTSTNIRLFFFLMPLPKKCIPCQNIQPSLGIPSQVSIRLQ